MLTVHTVIALSVVFNNYLYVVKPPHATKAIITFDYQLEKNLTRWVEMKTDQFDGVDVFKLSLQANISQADILTYKIKFYSNSYTRETEWQNFSFLETSIIQRRQVGDQKTCVDTLIVSIIILCFLFVANILYFYLSYIHKM